MLPERDFKLMGGQIGGRASKSSRLSEQTIQLESNALNSVTLGKITYCSREIHLNFSSDFRLGLSEKSAKIE